MAMISILTMSITTINLVCKLIRFSGALDPETPRPGYDVPLELSPGRP